MARNGEHDPDHDDDDHVTCPQMAAQQPPSFAFTATGQPRLITSKQPSVWEMVSHRHHEVC
jgi:hypothetical protein